MDIADENYRFELPHITGVVWCLDLDELRRREVEILGSLTGEEHGRLARLTGEPRLRSLAGAFLSRRELGRLLSLAPGDVRIARTLHGKPFLIDGQPTTHFSLAHAGQYVLFVMSRRLQVGADIETPRFSELVARRFHPSERAALAGLTGGARSRAFSRLWAAKEACVKCLGRGRISDVKTSLAREGRWRDVRWHRVEPSRDFVGVVATRVG